MKVRALLATIATIGLFIPSVGLSSSDINQAKLEQLARTQTDYQQQIAEKEQEILMLTEQLDEVDSQTAQRIFRYGYKTCGVATIAGVFLMVAPSRGRSQDEKLGNAMAGMFIGGAAGVCTAITYAIYEVINGDSEKLETLLDAATIELERLKLQQQN